MKRTMTSGELLDILHLCEETDDVTCEIRQNGTTKLCKIKGYKQAEGVLYLKLRPVSFKENITSIDGEY